MVISTELAHEHVESGLYNNLALEMVEMETAALATAEYNKDFH